MVGVVAQQMLRATPKSLNALSYEAVIEMLEAIRDISPAPPSVQHVVMITMLFINKFYSFLNFCPRLFLSYFSRLQLDHLND